MELTLVIFTGFLFLATAGLAAFTRPSQSGQVI